jgi:predicted esterase
LKYSGAEAASGRKMPLRLLIFLSIFLFFSAVAENEPAYGMLARSATLLSLFHATQARAFADTLPIDQPVHWQVYLPKNNGFNGVVVFVSPNASAAPQADWIEVLERNNLIWVAAQDFGNTEPTAKRIVAAIMGLTMVRQTFQIDNTRVYVAGMSGGGRVAGKVATMFPQLFTGAMYFVGTDFWTAAEKPLLERIAKNRYVFLTGENDFNRRETRRVYKKYLRAGVSQVLLMDLPSFGHQYPNGEQFNQAVMFLQTGVPPEHR